MVQAPVRTGNTAATKGSQREVSLGEIQGIKLTGRGDYQDVESESKKNIKEPLICYFERMTHR